jgi:NAD(P)-dependent dehydrogenase (short-subunit alcohol dehydrogenase family)
LHRDGTVLETDLEVLDGTMQVNARGYFLCTRYALPVMLERGGGSIVYTSSGAAYGAEPIRVCYAMNKEAGHALMRHVAAAYGAQGIRANSIAPGIIRHDRWSEWDPGIIATLEESGTAQSLIKRRLGRSDDIASLGTLLLSDEGSYITGQVISVDGWTILRP